MAAAPDLKIRVQLDKIVIDPADRRNMENYPVALGDLVVQLCDRLDLDPHVVGEIMVIYPATLEVRVQLLNADGKKYVWGAAGDPDQVPAGDPRHGNLAEEIRVYRIDTSKGANHGDHAPADHPVPQDPDREGPAPDSEGP